MQLLDTVRRTAGATMVIATHDPAVTEVVDQVVVAVTGPSGTGKSCLLAGLAVPQEGNVRVLGRPLEGADPRPRRRIGLVLQGYGLVSLLTASENVEVTCRPRTPPPPAP